MMKCIDSLSVSLEGSQKQTTTLAKHFPRDERKNGDKKHGFAKRHSRSDGRWIDQLEA